MSSYIFSPVPILQPGITLGSVEVSHSSYCSWCLSQPLPIPGTRTGKRHTPLDVLLGQAVWDYSMQES